jgi:hypothetical protein
VKNSNATAMPENAKCSVCSKPIKPRGYLLPEFNIAPYCMCFSNARQPEIEDSGNHHIVPPHSNATTTNPKDIVGSTKVSLSKFPQIGIVHGAMAMMDGAQKYGPYNWRAKDVLASIYVDAIMRHLADWFEGEEVAGDSKVHHLGHAIACCAILLDAQAHGNLIDDRPIKRDESGVPQNPGWMPKLLSDLAEIIKSKQP